ncbi:VOC family protein, partial [Piscinibacter sp.]|uniref:VOC family protein n=1 Tax=Piscinibacter sp. TaxID=1903157 RepID=UPI003783A4C5
APPSLVQWVARCDDLAAALAALARQGIDGGRVLQLARPTPQGELRWRIAVRADGRRPAGGLPTLIEWGEVHPADHLAASPLRLAAFDERRLVAEIDSPKGRVRLEGLA